MKHILISACAFLMTAFAASAQQKLDAPEYMTPYPNSVDLCGYFVQAQTRPSDDGSAGTTFLLPCAESAENAAKTEEVMAQYEPAEPEAEGLPVMQSNYQGDINTDYSIENVPQADLQAATVLRYALTEMGVTSIVLANQSQCDKVASWGWKLQSCTVAGPNVSTPLDEMFGTHDLTQMVQ